MASPLAPRLNFTYVYVLLTLLPQLIRRLTTLICIWGKIRPLLQRLEEESVVLNVSC